MARVVCLCCVVCLCSLRRWCGSARRRRHHPRRRLIHRCLLRHRQHLSHRYHRQRPPLRFPRSCLCDLRKRPSAPACTKGCSPPQTRSMAKGTPTARARSKQTRGCQSSCIARARAWALWPFTTELIPRPCATGQPRATKTSGASRSARAISTRGFLSSRCGLGITQATCRRARCVAAIVSTRWSRPWAPSPRTVAVQWVST